MACDLRTTSSPLIGPSTLPFTTTRRALMPPRMTAFGETVSEVQCRSPSTCPLTSTAPSALTLPTILSPSAITVPFRFNANMCPSYAILDAPKQQRRAPSLSLKPAKGELEHAFFALQIVIVYASERKANARSLATPESAAKDLAVQLEKLER